jgi:hypothetical protein
MSKRRYAHKGGSLRSAASFVRFEHRMLQHPRFLGLSGRACKTLLFLASQYTGSNNGDLTIAWKVAKSQGLTANGNLRKAAQELIEAGFLVQTRQGGRNRCSLFALAWFPINDCNGKLDVSATAAPPNDWLFTRGNLSEPPGVQLAPPGVQSAQKSPTEMPH